MASLYDNKYVSKEWQQQQQSLRLHSHSHKYEYEVFHVIIRR